MKNNFIFVTGISIITHPKISDMITRLKRITATCVLALAACGIMCATSRQAETIPDQMPPDESADLWITILVSNNLAEATAAAGGKWIPAAELQFSGAPDSAYDGFTLPNINSALIFKKSVLDKFIKPEYKICDQFFNNISFEDYQKLPLEKILCAGVMTATIDGTQESIVRLVLNNEDYKKNPCTNVIAVIEVVAALQQMQSKN